MVSVCCVYQEPPKQWKKLQLSSADADLGLQNGTESGLLCQDLPCSASAMTRLRIVESWNC